MREARELRNVRLTDDDLAKIRQLLADYSAHADGQVLAPNGTPVKLCIADDLVSQSLPALLAEVTHLRRQVSGLWNIVNTARRTLSALHMAYMQAMTAISAAVPPYTQRHIASKIKMLDEELATLDAMVQAAEAELAPPAPQSTPVPPTPPA